MNKPNLFYLVVIRHSSLFAKCPVKKLQTNIFRKRILKLLTVKTVTYDECWRGHFRETTQYCINNKMHREDGPALQYKCACSIFIEWKMNGELHRNISIGEKVVGPAYIELDLPNKQNEILYGIIKWYKHGVLHNGNIGPAVIKADIMIVNNQVIIKNNSHYVYARKWYTNGLKHRNGGPAIITKYDNNDIKKWYIDGQLSRVGGPNVVITKDRSITQKWLVNGELNSVNDNPDYIKTADNYIRKKWHLKGALHRNNNPARIIHINNTIKHEWYCFGRIHRKADEPAVLEWKDNELILQSWFHLGNRHRDDFSTCGKVGGPAYIRHMNINGKKIIVKKWYNDGCLHRIDGPAIECFEEDVKDPIIKEWWDGNYRHRSNGPAVIIRKNSLHFQEMECYYKMGVSESDPFCADAHYVNLIHSN